MAPSVTEEILSTKRPATRPAARKSTTLFIYFRQYMPTPITATIGIMKIIQSIIVILLQFLISFKLNSTECVALNALRSLAVSKPS